MPKKLIFKMTKRNLSLARCLPNGITDKFRTPCHGINFTEETITELIKEKLPKMLSAMGEAWADIPSGYVTGLAPLSQGGPIDECKKEGVWSAERQAAHGGPIPFLSGASESRGIPETWPYAVGGNTAPKEIDDKNGKEKFDWAFLQFESECQTRFGYSQNGRHAADTQGRAERACGQPVAKAVRDSDGNGFNWNHWLLYQPVAGNQSSWDDWHFEQKQKASFEKQRENKAKKREAAQGKVK